MLAIGGGPAPDLNPQAHRHPRRAAIARGTPRRDEATNATGSARTALPDGGAVSLWRNLSARLTLSARREDARVSSMAPKQPRTAAAEMAFYRSAVLRRVASDALARKAGEFTAFNAPVRTEMALDLTNPPLDADRANWTQLIEYEPCQALAESRAQGPDESHPLRIRARSHASRRSRRSCRLIRS